MLPSHLSLSFGLFSVNAPVLAVAHVRISCCSLANDRDSTDHLVNVSMFVATKRVYSVVGALQPMILLIRIALSRDVCI